MGFTPEEIQDIKQRIKETIELLENTPPHISRYERELSFRLARWSQQDLWDNSVDNGKDIFKGKSKNAKILKGNEGIVG